VRVERARPTIDADNRPYWEAARNGELVLQRCTECGAARFYPRSRCPECWADATEWFAASGRGSVYSYTVVHRAPAPAFRDAVPYVVGLIELAEGPRMLSNVVCEDPESVGIGDRVRVRFDAAEDGFAIPVFVRESQ